MKTSSLRLTALLLVAPFAIFTAGCVAARTAANDTVAWIRGAIEETVDAPLARVGDASVAAVREMKFLEITSKVDVVEGEIKASTAQDTGITILLNRVTPNATKISIRVGALGDEALSRMILDEIKKNL